MPEHFKRLGGYLASLDALRSLDKLRDNVRTYGTGAVTWVYLRDLGGAVYVVKLKFRIEQLRQIICRKLHIT